MKAVKTHPSWYDVEKAIRVTGDQMLAADIDPKYIIGLARGGLVPGVLASHMLDLPFVAVNYSSKDGRGEYKGHDNILPDIGDAGLGYRPNLLIVDDICDSGLTMKEVVDHYKNIGHMYVYTLAIHYKESSIFKPDFFCYHVPADGPWLHYPWE